MGTNLTSLPPEVRLVILKHVILSPARVVPLDFSAVPASLSAPTELPLQGGQGENFYLDRRVETDDVSYASWSRGEAIFYEKDPRAYDSNAWRLMSVNRQLYVEVKALVRSMSSWCALRNASSAAAKGHPVDFADLSTGTNPGAGPAENGHDDDDHKQGESKTRHKSSFVQYDLDILIAQDGQLMPTWLWIPFKTTYIDELNISIRSMGTLNRWITDSAFWERQGGQNPSFGWLLCSLLERFLQLGASSPRDSSATGVTMEMETASDGIVDEHHEGPRLENPPDDMEFCIGCVNIELEDPEQQKYKDERTKEEQQGHMPDFTEHVRNLAVRPLYASSQSATSTSGMSAETLANRLISRISELLSFALYQFRERLAFYERMTVVRFRFRGQTMCQWDLSNLLKPLHSRQLVFFHEQIIARQNNGDSNNWLQWSMRIADKRRTLGLLVSDQDVHH